MLDLLSNINIQVNNKLFLKNPDTSDLGKKIVQGSIELIDDIGFENFTFKKLGKKIGSTEASIYRYFESKNKLLLYLISWYWTWLEYKLVFSIANIVSPNDRLTRSLNILTSASDDNEVSNQIETSILFRIVISESSKSYHTKEVDKVNEDGVFLAYKRIVERVADIILEINPNYKFPHMLISTVIEGAHHQRFFAEHLPRLTDVLKDKDSVPMFYEELVFKVITNK